MKNERVADLFLLYCRGKDGHLKQKRFLLINLHSFFAVIPVHLWQHVHDWLYVDRLDLSYFYYLLSNMDMSRKESKIIKSTDSYSLSVRCDCCSVVKFSLRRLYGTDYV